MKVCFLVNQLSLKDGWGSYAVNLIKHLSEKGVDCLVLSSIRGQQNDLSSIKDYKILPPLFVSRWIKIYFLIKNFFKIRKLIQEADIVHVLAEPYSLIAYWTHKKCPMFITFHGTYAVDALNKWYLRGLYKRVYKNVKKIICVSKFTKEEVLKKIPLENIIVINNGVDYKKFQMYTSFKYLRNTKNIISVGALMSRKGYHISILAIAKVKKKHPNLKYYIIGNQKNKKYFNQLKNLVKDYSLEENIVFLENVLEKDLIKFYYQSDLFLLTPIHVEGSKFEGFGLVYLEANACGKPVIGTYGCGAEDAIIDGFNGLLVPQNDIAKTSQAILSVLDNLRLAEELSQNGLKQAQKMDWSNIVEQYIQIY
ncbi:glycosyltransferase family 4 protein [Patescibacteria group bacterium]|nr:glycosyltransferase family 4 protein [Patescibacteria group bacterium]MBU2472732.1 glycosyltransferase family 4 protein [Patescibacteria group bacterium]